MLKNLGERSDYTCELTKIPFPPPFSRGRMLTKVTDNTVLFFRWVIVENTLVMVASSVPLLRPLFSAAKKTAMTHYGSNSAYELGSRQNGSTSFAYGKNTAKSHVEASSSEENILPIQKVPLGTKERVQHFGKGDVEQGVIKKEVQYQVKYETDPKAGLSAETTEWDPHSNGVAK
jgi:hypothetical protein